VLSERDLSIIVDGREKDFEIEEGPRLKLRLNRKALLQASPARLVRHAWMDRANASPYFDFAARNFLLILLTFS
jgi:hypothetical protein